MEADEIIRVVEEFRNGKQIECREISSDVWSFVEKPVWNFGRFDYRVREEGGYRPYQSLEEVDAAIRRHGPFIMMKSTKTRLIINSYDDEAVFFPPEARSWKDVIESKEYVWPDGHPIGVKIK